MKMNRENFFKEACKEIFFGVEESIVQEILDVSLKIESVFDEYSDEFSCGPRYGALYLSLFKTFCLDKHAEENWEENLDILLSNLREDLKRSEIVIPENTQK